MSERTWTTRQLAVWTAIAAAGAIGVAVLLVSVFEHREEARNPFYRVVELTDDTEDPAIWG